MYRTKTCGELRIENAGESVELAGWIQKIRNLGGMLFIDLRDEFGITQIVLNDDKLQEQAKDFTTESCITVTGEIVERTNKNPNMPTGDVEVVAKKIEVLGKCKNVLPFEINSNQDVREDLRLEYRFLDLRNEKLHKNILLRSQILKTFRDKMDELGFTEIQTPILANSSPEGARDYLVPSRLNPGEFYALPQAPQQFKQLLMVSGFNKYFQIAPCFRDEDPRADRSPGEFYQLDFEMSFATQDDVLKVLETVILNTFRKHAKGTVDLNVSRIPYLEAIEKYGSDKPDLRNPLIIEDVTSILSNLEFRAFQNKIVKAIKIPNGASQTRKFFDNLSEYVVEELGAKGLAWLKIENGLNGSIAKFITPCVEKDLIEKIGAKEADAVVFIADDKEKASKIAGGVRIELGKRLNLIEKDVFRFCFIVDFPMYELSDEGIINFNHNPFSMPQGGMESILNSNPLDILAFQYDMVCNGYELASGAVRNHDQDVMIKAFEIAGYTKEDVEKKFGALFKAFSYGTPPHAGAAPGVDRIVMLIAGEENIREVIAFPKNKKARDLMMKAPSAVTQKQLDEVHIALKTSEKK